MHLSNNSNKTLVSSLLYLSLLVGFYFGENSSGGAYPDFVMRMDLIDKFQNDFSNSFLNYDNFNDRHSPLLIMIISFLNIKGIHIDLIRFIHLNLLPLLVIVSYKCLTLKFNKNNKNIIFLICCVFFLSPSLRSIAIWPDSRLIGLFLFISSIYFFLNFKRNHKYKDCINNNILLILSAYFSPNFSIFFLYFFFYYIEYFNISKKLFLMIAINILLSLPMFIYIFLFDVNFFSINAVTNINFLDSLNLSNKVFIISTLVFFYMFPFIFNFFSMNFFIKNFNINHFFYSLILFFCLLYFFNYSIEYTGGGIFFKFSYLLFDNSYLFFFIVFISLIFIFNIFKLNFNNLLLFFILVVSNPQLTIYHKYFDPLLILLFLLFFDFKFLKEKIINTKFLKNIYLFYFIFLFINFGRLFI